MKNKKLPKDIQYYLNDQVAIIKLDFINNKATYCYVDKNNQMAYNWWDDLGGSMKENYKHMQEGIEEGHIKKLNKYQAFAIVV